MKHLAFILTFFATIPALAAPDTEWCAVGSARGKMLSAVALNAGATARTFVFGPVACGRKVGSYRYIEFEAEYTHATNGNVLLTCTHGQRAATADKTPQVCTGAGTCTLVDAGVLSKVVSGSKKFSGRIGLRGRHVWKVVASHDNAPVAGDKLTLYVYLTD